MKWFRNILKGMSLTTALFVFQACYGTYMGEPDIPFVFHVTSAQTGEDLEGVIVKAKIDGFLDGRVLTGGNGMAYCYLPEATRLENDVQFVIETEDLSYMPKDTTIRWTMETDVIEIKLHPAEK